MNLPTTRMTDGDFGDEWDDALLSAGQKDFKNVSESTLSTPFVFEDRSNFDFRPDHKSVPMSSVKTQLAVVKTSLPITRLSLIPTTTKSKVPALPVGHALIPLSGILVAITFLLIAQVTVPRGLLTTLDNLVVAKLSNLISEPIIGIKNKLNEGLSVASLGAQEKVLVIKSIVNPVINQPVKEIRVGQSNSVYLTAAVSGFFPVIDLVWSSCKQVIYVLWEALLYYKNLAVTNWLNFWSGEPEPVAVSDETILRAQIKNEILAELRGDLAPLLNTNSPAIARTSSGQGLVVVPQSKAGDEAEAVTKIKSLFSDPVLVDFDRTGQSGVITPLFGNVTGENYIFVLTPIATQ